VGRRVLHIDDQSLKKEIREAQKEISFQDTKN
jgi:hypothetical protein